MNIADLFVIIIVALLIFFAVFRIVRNKKKGKCNCGCSSCPNGMCTKRQEQDE